MLRKLSVVLISAGALALGACSSNNTPPVDLCMGVTAPCTQFPTGTAESAISAAISSAATGTTFVFGAGTFAFTNGLATSTASGLTISGAGIGQTVLDFGGQVAGAAGITASGNSKLSFIGFTIQNTPGDGIKVEGGNGILFEKVEAIWTTTNRLTHGAYGLYPVQSQSILVDNCVANGARDTGIYVGQSNNIVVSNNEVLNNVAGIEIESSVNADVHNNNAHDNAGGILVFALPMLQPPPGTPEGTTDGTMNVRVYANNIHDNNTTNFGDPSETVSGVPAGTGSFVLASSYVEYFGNTFTNNNTIAFAVVSYYIYNPTFDAGDTGPGGQNPTGLNPIPSNIYVHDNIFTNNGTTPISDNELPDGGPVANEFGSLLAFLVASGDFAPSGGAVSSMVWDGIPTADYPVNYAIQSNGTGTFCNLNFPELVPCGNATCITPSALDFDAGPFAVTAAPAGFPLPAVDAGVTP